MASILGELPRSWPLGQRGGDSRSPSATPVGALDAVAASGTIGSEVDGWLQHRTADL